MAKSAKYSSTFQPIEEYLPARAWISKTATRNHDQCRKTSIPRKRKRRIDPVVVACGRLYNRVVAFTTDTAVPGEYWKKLIAQTCKQFPGNRHL